MINSIMKNKSTLPYIKVLVFVLALLFFLFIWDLAAKMIDEIIILPSVRKTVDALCKIVTSGNFFSLIFTALKSFIKGLLLGIISGVILAIVCHKSEVITVIVSPVISILKATPIACVIVLLWVSLTVEHITVYATLIMVLPIVWQNIYDGLDSIDQNMLEVASVFKLGKWQRFKVIYVPTVLAYLVPAVITSVGLAWKAEIAAEIMTYSNIGYLIREHRTYQEAESIFAWTILIITFSILFEQSVKYLLGRLENALKA